MIVIRVLVAVVAFIHFGHEGILPKTFHLPASTLVAAARLAGSAGIGVLELICIALLIIGLFTRLAILPLLVISLLAIFSSKLPHLNVQSIFSSAPDTGRYGAWSIVQDVRADFVILFGGVFLLYEGAGRLSLDWWITARLAIMKAKSASPRLKLPADAGKP